jgi:hypothetical protein
MSAVVSIPLGLRSGIDQSLVIADGEKADKKQPPFARLRQKLAFL